MNPTTAQRYRVRRLESIREVDDADWDALNGTEHVFHSHRFIAAVEAAQVEAARFRYLMFYEGETLAGTAVLSAFVVNLDIFLEGAGAGLVACVRKLWQGWLKIRILFCGLPVSLGQHNFVVREDADSDALLDLLAEEMEKTAREWRVKYLSVKEFRENEIGKTDRLAAHGYFRGLSIPYMEMELPWEHWEGYLGSLRAHYRRKIKLSQRKLQHNSPLPGQATHPQEVRIAIGDAEICPPETFHELYLNVMARAETRLETLNAAFFRELYARCAGKFHLIALKRGAEILSVAMLFPHGAQLTWALVGQQPEPDETVDPYFNLVYAILQFALANGFKKLGLGQTAYWVKQRVGARPVQEYLYLRAKNGLLHRILKMLRKELFPETKLPEVRVFKERR